MNHHRTLCAWAACHRPAHRWADGWWHCHKHYPEHLRLVDKPLPRTPDPDQVRAHHAQGLCDRDIAIQLGFAREDITAVRIRLQLPTIPQPPGAPVHGTRNGYQRHKKAGEQPCVDCLHAERTYQRNRKRDRRKQAAA